MPSRELPVINAPPPLPVITMSHSAFRTSWHERTRKQSGISNPAGHAGPEPGPARGHRRPDGWLDIPRSAERTITGELRPAAPPVTGKLMVSPPLAGGPEEPEHHGQPGGAAARALGDDFALPAALFPGPGRPRAARPRTPAPRPRPRAPVPGPAAPARPARGGPTRPRSWGSCQTRRCRTGAGATFPTGTRAAGPATAASHLRPGTRGSLIFHRSGLTGARQPSAEAKVHGAVARHLPGRRAICHQRVGYALRSELRRCKRRDIASGSQRPGVRDLVVENPASSTQRSQRAVQPSHAAEFYWAAGSSLP